MSVAPGLVDPKTRRVLCAACKNPIHINDLGGCRMGDDGEEWFHRWLPCLLEIAKETKKEDSKSGK